MNQAKTIKPETYCALYHFSSNKQIINGLFQEGVKKGGQDTISTNFSAKFADWMK